MEANIVGAIVIALAIFGIIVSTIGFISFTNAFKNEYSVTTYHMADTATTLINGDHIDDYLESGENEEYLTTKSYLDAYCKKINVSTIYVISVDRSDYASFVSVFDLIDNSVDDTAYTEWELGHERATSNEEYMEKYREIYENGSLYETVYRKDTTDGLHPHVTTLVPVKDSSGSVSAILCMQRPIRELYDARRPYFLTVAISTALLAAAASVLAAAYIRKRFVSPIRKVSVEATRFAKENTIGEPLGKISRYKEISNLASSIDTMEKDMVNYMDNLTRAAAEKERIVFELSLASTIQENSIPNEFPAFPERGDFDIYASMTPAKEVGGDFYNFFFIDDDHLAMVIGDVSGKGIPAALFMMVTNILIRDRTSMGGSPSEILEFVNKNICRHNKADMFVSVWLGILELSTGRLTAANAGHEYPAICRAGSEFEIYKDKHGFVIGGLEDSRYNDYELHIDPGDKLFVYTDGVPEATASDNEMFGIDRMISTLNKDVGASPEQILDNIRDSVRDFVKGAEQFDDLTMLCFEYKGNDRIDE